MSTVLTIVVAIIEVVPAALSTITGVPLIENAPNGIYDEI